MRALAQPAQYDFVKKEGEKTNILSANPSSTISPSAATKGNVVTISGGALPSMFNKVGARIPMQTERNISAFGYLQDMQGHTDQQIDRNKHHYQNANINTYLDFSGVYNN